MAIRIPKATDTDAGLGREQQRAVNVTQDINASPIGPNRFSVASEVGQAGQSIANNLGQVAVKRYEQQLKVADENATMNSYSGFSKEVNELANIGDDAWFIRKGEKSFNTYAEAQQAMDKLAEKYSQNLTNDRQKNQFFRLVADRRASMEESLSRYEASQRSAYNIESEKSFIQTNIQNAVLNYTDPNQIELAKKQITETTLKNREGLPKDALDLRLQSRLSLLQTGIIEKLSSTSPYKAYALFQKTKDSLTPEDRERANNYVERGAEENFYALLEQDPVKAAEALDKGFYGGILDNKKRNQFRNAIDTQVNNMARRAETKQFMSTLKNEQQLFDSIIGSNREDAFKKLYEYGRGFNADPAFIEKTRDILLQSKGPSISEKQATIADLETKFLSFKVTKDKETGEYEIEGNTQLKDLVAFNRDVELARLNGSISGDIASGYRKRATKALIAAVKKEQGYDDLGWGSDDKDEDYDLGTQKIQDYVDKNKLGNTSPVKVRMISQFIEAYDRLPEETKQNLEKRNEAMGKLADMVIAGKTLRDYPELVGKGVPNQVLNNDGVITNKKEGASTLKASNKVKSLDNIEVRNYGDNAEIRIDTAKSTAVFVDKSSGKVIGTASVSADRKLKNIKMNNEQK